MHLTMWSTSSASKLNSCLASSDVRQVEHRAEWPRLRNHNTAQASLNPRVLYLHKEWNLVFKVWVRFHEYEFGCGSFNFNCPRFSELESWKRNLQHHWKPKSVREELFAFFAFYVLFQHHLNHHWHEQVWVFTASFSVFPHTCPFFYNLRVHLKMLDFIKPSL